MIRLPLFQKNKQSGFTIIELLIVIAIIGILVTLGLGNFNGSRMKARDAKRKSDLRSIKLALQLYMDDYRQFPASSASGGQIVGCGTAAGPATACSWGGSFNRGTTTYMGFLPRDPVATQAYTYATSATVDYLLTATLENTSDPDSAASQTRCGVTPVAGRYVVCNQ